MDHARNDRLAAGLAVLAVHATLLGLLARPAREHAATPGRPLEVVFLVAAPAIEPAPRRPATRAARTSSRPGSARTAVPRPAVDAAEVPPAPVPPSDPAPVPPSDPAPATSRPLSAVYLQQARQWDARQAEPAPSDPFADRTPPAVPDGRFRMRRPTSAADVVASVGKLFGGAGYTTDDCARMRGSITGLMVAGDTRGAQEAIDYERRHCRP